jgi:RNA polymerase primary sigma factor
LMDILSDPTNPLPDKLLMTSSLGIEIKRALATLSERESNTIILFYGIGLEQPLTLEEIGQRYEITRERVRQIKDKAIRRLRVSGRSKLLRTYLG